MGLVWRTGNPPPMLSRRGLSPFRRILRIVRLAVSMPTRQLSALRHCEPTWKVTPARSAFSSAASAMISSASSGCAPNLPDSGQSLPTLGASMRRYRLASGLIATILRSSSTLSSTYHCTPLRRCGLRCSCGFSPGCCSRSLRPCTPRLKQQVQLGGGSDLEAHALFASACAARPGAGWPSPRSAGARAAWRP